MNPPKEFICPITMDIMSDPVVMPDGHTYEREAITQALIHNAISPLTRQPMKISDARTNYALKSLIDSWSSNYFGSSITPLQSSSSSSSSNHIDLQSIHLKAAQEPQPIRHIELSQFIARFKKDDNTNHLHIRITPKLIDYRLPVALIAMIDISGSMEMNACEHIPGIENINISRLQLVQHALKMIVEILCDTDEIVFITFDTRAELVLPATRMTSEGKSRANEIINNMYEKGATNIWDALRLGLEQAKGFSGRGFNTSLLLFTDGEPNQNPPMGIIPTLTEALSNVQQDFIISTFSFGYSIDSDLMENIARLGHGIYGYCPDCTMVGTVFINFLASILTTIVQRAILKIRNQTSESTYILTLVNGSSRNILVDIPDIEFDHTQIMLSIPNTGDQFIIEEIQSIINLSDELELLDQIYRRKYIKVISDNLLTPQIGFQQIHDLFTEINALSKSTPYLTGLTIDLVNAHANHGQVSKAFQSNYFSKWGKDYLRSHLLFHLVEQCGNFKDQSLQYYTGIKFNEYRTLANKIFLAIPPPIDRVIHHTNNITSSNGPINMTSFHNYHGGCFDGNALVSLKVGMKRVRDLMKGDILINGGIVECLIETILNGQSEAVILNDVIFTPFHPVKLFDNWIFPCDIASIVKVEINSWFNLVLKGNKIVVLNGISAITLGHGLCEGILEHPYFGTDKVVNALKLYKNYETGRLRIENPVQCQRDENGMIIELY
jgi:hypothetical protein